MALDKNDLADRLKTTFKRSKEEEWSSDQVADELADAIDAFVRGGDVVNVTVDVSDFTNNPIGTGTQTGVGSIQ